MRTAVVTAAATLASAAYLKVASHTDAELMSVFETWMAEHNKIYSPEEKSYRFPIFVKTLRDIEESSIANPEIEFGLNDFADMPDEEAFSHMGLLSNGPVMERPEPSKLAGKPLGAPKVAEERDCAHWNPDPYSSPPKCLDWTKYQNIGCVTPARKPQASCQASLAFSMAAAWESIMCRDTKTLEALSPQMIVDCVPEAEGCNDFPRNVDDVVQFAPRKGMCADSEYPWVGTKGECKRSKCSYEKLGGSDTVYNISKRDDDDMKEYLMLAPIIATVSVSGFPKMLRNYKSGVLTRKACWDSRPMDSDEAPRYDHFVTIVGYNQEDETVFKVKNSWGASWGENGFVRMESAGCGLGDRMHTPHLFDTPKRLREHYRKSNVLGKPSFDAEADEDQIRM